MPARSTLLIVLLLTACPVSAGDDTWPQWGGPQRDFSVASARLADAWPAEGPKRLWQRPLGDGYAGLVSDGKLVFTMYRPSLDHPEEVVVALDARSGETVWEQRFPSELKKPVSEHGHGPFSTPVLAGDHLYAIGTQAVVRCFERRTGKLVWSRDLPGEFLAPPDTVWGYAVSPVVHDNLLIIPLGYQQRGSAPLPDGPPMPGSGGDGRDRSLLALQRSDGKKAWQGAEYIVGQSSPMKIEFAGQHYVVILVTDRVIGIDPSSGQEAWDFRFGASSVVSTTPNWDGKDLLWFPSQGGPGRGIRLKREDGKTVAENAWTSPKMSSPLYTGVQDGKAIYLPGGNRMFAFDQTSGALLWAEHGFESASCIQADGKLLILDQNGQLTLATATPEKLTIQAQTQVTERVSLTCPILVGRTLVVRDRKSVVALDVGR